MHIWCPWWSEEVTGSPWPGVLHGCDPHYECRKWARVLSKSSVFSSLQSHWPSPSINPLQNVGSYKLYIPFPASLLPFPIFFPTLPPSVLTPSLLLFLSLPPFSIPVNLSTWLGFALNFFFQDQNTYLKNLKYGINNFLKCTKNSTQLLWQITSYLCLNEDLGYTSSTACCF